MDAKNGLENLRNLLKKFIGLSNGINNLYISQFPSNDDSTPKLDVSKVGPESTCYTFEKQNVLDYPNEGNHTFSGTVISHRGEPDVCLSNYNFCANVAHYARNETNVHENKYVNCGPQMDATAVLDHSLNGCTKERDVKLDTEHAMCRAMGVEIPPYSDFTSNQFARIEESNSKLTDFFYYLHDDGNPNATFDNFLDPSNTPSIKMEETVEKHVLMTECETDDNVTLTIDVPNELEVDVEVEPCNINIDSLIMERRFGCDNSTMVVPTSDQGTKKYCCVYCEKRFSKLVRHLAMVHKDEVDVKKFQDLPVGTIVMEDNRFEDDENKKTRKKIVKKDVEKVQHSKPKIDNDVAGTETTTSLLSVTSVKPAQPEDVEGKEGENRCTTPQGRPGRCEDLSVCPELLLNLGDLRDSLCFKRLFIPGVCCPTQESTILTTQRPTILTIRPPIQTTQQSLILTPYPTTQRPTQRPLIPIQSVSRPPPNAPANAIDEVVGNLLQADECGQQEHNSGRIVGGIESASGEWPWVAAIFLHGAKRTEFWCGGSLIGSKYVLTAAHCTRDSKQKPFAARQFTVRLGDIDLSTDKEPSAPVTFKVSEVRTHPRFSRVGFYNDIAVLVLDRPVRKSKYVIPVCLPKIGHIPPPERLAGRRATVVGWGTTYYGGKESTIQRQADLPIWRNEDCNRAYFQPITENFLCAGYSEGGVDACQGDSGGPLMMRINQRWTQLGILSFGNKCGEPGYPGVYTRLSEYTDWIEENTIN